MFARRGLCVVGGLCAAGVAMPALAQSNIEPLLKFAWTENTGWLNWRDAGNPAGSQGARILDTYMAGFVWGENIGWINLGDGTPGNGVSYANVDGSDFGVNIAGDGVLSGLAWGENVGWINFNTAPTLLAFNQHARVDRPAARLRGYAWGENIGWVNLDDATKFVGIDCPTDFDDDGFVDFFDFDAYVACFEGLGCPPGKTADFDGDGFVDFFDFDAFVAAFEAGC